MPTTKPKRTGRNARLAAVHCERKQRGIPEEAYRDLLRAEFGVASSKELTDAQLWRLAAILRGEAAPLPGSPDPTKNRPTPRPEVRGLCAKIYKQCESLAEAGFLPLDPGKTWQDYVDAVAYNVLFRGQKVIVKHELLSGRQLVKVVQALAVHQKRHGVATGEK
ncbi:MAG: DUF1018 domain-containing protein [Magnetococcales bacterium]|nr:DUF1018 domain-containing protein [Magnetococcales bacterium]